MKITILAFAHAREALGFSEKMVDLRPGATADSVLKELSPQAKKIMSGARVAIDLEYTDWTQPLRDGQTMAIIPPVSGG